VKVVHFFVFVIPINIFLVGCFCFEFAGLDDGQTNCLKHAEFHDKINL
jgi:hypothetical protein